MSRSEDDTLPGGVAMVGSVRQVVVGRMPMVNLKMFTLFFCVLVKSCRQTYATRLNSVQFIVYVFQLTVQ